MSAEVRRREPIEIKQHVTNVLLNNTGRYWPRTEILKEVNNWITSFPNEEPVDMTEVENAIISLAFDDNLIDERRGDVKLNMERYAVNVARNL